MTEHLSTLTLHQLRYGELSGGELAAAQSHLDVCGHCTARLEAQHKERAAFVMQPVPSALRRAARRRPSVWHRLRWALPALAVAAVAVIAVTSAPPPGDVIIEKGERLPLEVWVDVGDGPRLHRPDEALREGDRVQLKYRANGATHAAVAGRDASGQVEVYGSFETSGGAELTDIPFGLTLDGAPGRQELYVILADRPVHSGEVRAAVTGHPAPIEGLRVLRADLPKESATP